MPVGESPPAIVIEPPAPEPEAPSPPPGPEPEKPKVPKAAPSAKAVNDDPEAQDMFERMHADGPSDELEAAKQDVREAFARVRAAGVKEALINRCKLATVGKVHDGEWTGCRDAAVLTEFARQVAALVPPEKGGE